MKKLVTLLLIAILVLGNTSFAETKSETLDDNSKYQYPLTRSSDNWFDYSVSEKKTMLRIDNQILASMSDKQLVYAIAEYPYLVDLYAYDFSKEGIDTFSKECSAYAELSKRTSFKESLTEYGKKVIEECSLRSEDSHSRFVSGAMQDLIDFACGKELVRYAVNNVPAAWQGTTYSIWH